MPHSLRDDHEETGERAVGSVSRSPAKGPLDAKLRELLDDVTSVDVGINSLVPFPTIPTPSDIRIIDVAAAASVAGRALATVELTTATSVDEVVAFYNKVLRTTGATHRSDVAVTPSHVIVRGISEHDAQADTSLYVSLKKTDDVTCIKVRASYEGLDRAHFIDRYADWHLGTAPVADAPTDWFEVATMPAAGVPGRVGRYTTRFRLPGTEIAVVRPMIEHRLRQAGWTWIEVTPDELYLDGDFDAEVHTKTDGADTLIDFVGEFPLS